MTAECQCLGEPGAQEGLWDLGAGGRTIRDVISKWQEGVQSIKPFSHV